MEAGVAVAVDPPKPVYTILPDTVVLAEPVAPLLDEAVVEIVLVLTLVGF